MKYKFFYVPMICSEDIEHSLNSFLASQKVHAIDKQFSTCGNQAGWSFCISYDSSSSNSISREKNKVDYREILSPVDFDVFSELRRLRKKLAEEFATPVYLIFSNEQLATMVTKDVQTIADLKSIGGVEQARCEKYGQAFLNCLHAFQYRELSTKNVDKSSE